MKVVVTGSAGYIGGQIALALKDAGHEILGIDRRPCPSHLKEVFDQLVLADFDSDTAGKKLIQFVPDAIVHCAGTGEQWNRAGNRYRDHVAAAKYPVIKIES